MSIQSRGLMRLMSTLFIVALCLGCAPSAHELVSKDGGDAADQAEESRPEVAMVPQEIVSAPTIRTLDEFMMLTKGDKAPSLVLHFDVEWSAQAVTSRPNVAGLRREVRADPQLRNVVVRRMDCTEQRGELWNYVAMFLRNRGGKETWLSGGYGAVAWIDKGRVVDSVESAAATDVADLKARTLDKFGRDVAQHRRKPAFATYDPPELRFGCVVPDTRDEELEAVRLNERDPLTRLDAAQTLWRGRSRRYAADVIEAATELAPQSEEAREFLKQLEAELQTEAIARELNTGSRRWGAWLAYLRPHPDLVPILIEKLDAGTEYADAIALALGASRDPRALLPLTRLLKSDELGMARHALVGLSYLDDPRSEPYMLEVITWGGTGAAADACHILGRIGTKAALPGLHRVAAENREPGMFGDPSSAARHAIAAIEKRTRP